MLLKNTKDRFGFVAKFLHWTTALLIMTLLSVGFYMTSLGFSPTKLQIYMLHKSFGILVLMIVVLRIFWRLANPPPESLPTHKSWEKTLASFVHFFLYCVLIAMPLTGWIMSSAGDFPATFFGLFSLPHLVSKNQDIFNLTRNLHTYIALGILALLALHFAGAFKHHFIDRDATLQRMTKPYVGLVGGVLFAAVAGILWVAPAALFLKDQQSEEIEQSSAVSNAETPAAPAETSDGWVIDASASDISFEVKQYGETFNGHFKNFTGTIIFDPQDLDHGKANVEIDISSISTGSDDRDSQARSAEWFDTGKFPKAMFSSEKFTETAPGHYVASGRLTIRAVTLPIELPFTLTMASEDHGKQTAIMEATVPLKRLDFGVGQGQWAATDAIADEIILNIKVRATKP